MNVYIITGASKGLGQALAERLHGQGNRVIGISRSKGKTVGQFVECDLGDAGKISLAMDEVFAAIEFGETDVITLINNAADLNPIVPVGKATPEQIKKSFDINLVAPTILTSIFIQKTREFYGKRRIVNVTSRVAQKAYFGLSLYSSSKAGLEQFLQGVALEQESRPNPVLVLSVDPGSMDTNMQETIRGVSPENFPEVEHFKRRHQKGELPSPETLAELMIDRINSDNLVNGGLYRLMDRGEA